MTDLTEAIDILPLRRRNGTPRDNFMSRCFPMEGGCIGFRGHHNKGGYPRFTVAGTQRNASHVALACVGVNIPKGMQANHRCDNPACVNPDHLFLGSQDDNIKDMMRKDRHAVGDRHTISKLSSAAVKDIKENCRERGQPKYFAQKYGVSLSTIHAAKSGQNWKHVQ